MQETWVRFLSWEDPLEKEMATYSSIHAWRIPWTEEPGRLQSMGSKKSDMTERLILELSHYKVEPNSWLGLYLVVTANKIQKWQSDTM